MHWPEILLVISALAQICPSEHSLAAMHGLAFATLPLVASASTTFSAVTEKVNA